MAKVFCYGPSGWGKTTSMWELPPAKTGIISPDRKALPFSGWKKNYKTILAESGAPDFEKSNFVETSDPDNILKTLRLWNKRTDLDYLAVDTITHLMSAEFMRRIMDKGFDKFSLLGRDVNFILNFVRDECEKHIVVYAHNDVEFDAEGKKMNTVRSFGKLVNEKIEIPSVFTTVLMPMVRPTATKGKNEYLFITQSDGTNYAKSPVRMKLDEKGEATFQPVLPYEMPNNIKKVFDLLEVYENEG